MPNITLVLWTAEPYMFFKASYNCPLSSCFRVFHNIVQTSSLPPIQEVKAGVLTQKWWVRSLHQSKQHGESSLPFSESPWPMRLQNRRWWPGTQCSNRRERLYQQWEFPLAVAICVLGHTILYPDINILSEYHPLVRPVDEEEKYRIG